MKNIAILFYLSKIKEKKNNIFILKYLLNWYFVFSIYFFKMQFNIKFSLYLNSLNIMNVNIIIIIIVDVVFRLYDYNRNDKERTNHDIKTSNLSINSIHIEFLSRWKKNRIKNKLKLNLCLFRNGLLIKQIHLNILFIC